ncbi:MAG: ParB/RepB/Spo0J family partition protein [Desulfonauticus sp.]|nr:ParB/RepB/Spo0J family partition protein [Desulfonauticus sp.]
MNKKKGLGKGIGALLGDWQESSKDMEVTFLDLALISPNPHQPRQVFDSEALKTLADSIQSKGVLQPILVRPKGEKYEIIAGERRFRAAQIAGLEKIPAIIKNLSDREALLLALVENIHREDLNPIDQAKALLKLKKEFDLSQEELAQKVNLSRSQVANLIRLLSLPEKIQNLLLEGKLSTGQARALIGIDDPNVLENLVQEILEKNLTVRDVEKKVRQCKQNKKVDELLSNLEKQLQKSLPIKAKCRGTKDKGKIILEYANPEELKKILVLLQVEQANS